MILRDENYPLDKKEKPSGGKRATGSIVASCKEADEDAVVHCMLFGDIVAERVCELRRSELNNRGGFSCGECVVDLVINMQRESQRAGFDV